jgi:cytochrome c oxidase subunit 2
MNDTGTLQLPPQASTVAPDVDALYYFIFWGCTAFFVLIVGLAAFFAVKYRRRPGDTYRPSPSHNTPLEITWTVVPLLLVMIVFVWGFRGYMKMHTAPGQALEYNVIGKQWLWQINHPGGAVEVNQMYVPVDRPVRLLLQSEDVIHSFYVPDFRVKMDAYPNQYTSMWFEATRIGDFDLFCTEYCGNEHSAMIGKVHVLSQVDFDRWLEEAAPGPGDDPVAFGERLFKSKACNTCHSIDGSRLTGPTFQGLFGRQESLADGSTVIADENYIRRSILEPQAQITAGYDPVMPTYSGILRPQDIDALIEYIKTLQ